MENYDLNKIAGKVKLQEKKGDKIVKKKAGRPRIKPKKRVEIRMDSVLKNKFEQYDRDNGSEGPSAIIIPLVREFLKDKGYN